MGEREKIKVRRPVNKLLYKSRQERTVCMTVIVMGKV